MKYKLLVLDVDGVLVKSKDAPVSLGVINAVKKINTEVKVVLCTGRALPDVQRVIDSLEIAGNYHVIESGAKVLSPGGDYAFEKLLTGDEMSAIYNAACNTSSRISVCAEGKWIEYVSGNLYPEVTTVSLTSLNANQTKKILSTLTHLQDSVHIAVGSHWEIPGGNSILITNKNVSKRFGIEYIQHTYGIYKEETVAIGDMPNDLPLFEASGLKIAMGNGDIELKNKADFVTNSIDEDGVALAIETYLS